MQGVESILFFLRKLIRERTNGAGGKKARFCEIGALALTILFFLHAAHAATDSSAGSLDQQSILQLLNKVMDWYQHQSVNLETAVSPADVAFANENVPAAEQVVRLSFDFAHAGVQLLGKNGKPLSADSRIEALQQKTAQLEAEENQSQTQLRLLQQALASAPKKKRRAV